MVGITHIGEPRPLEIIAAANTLGEGVLWDGATQSLWWTDIEGRQLHRFDWTHRTMQLIDTPERLGSFGLVAGSDQLITAFASGIALYDPSRQQVQWLARPDAHLRHLRFNDGRVDRQGRFWTGTLSEDGGNPLRASLYSLTRGELHRQLTDVRISNGLCFSPDGSQGYFADSPTRIVRSFQVPPPAGRAKQWREFARTHAHGEPDGACVDSEGHVWSAQWGGGCVVRFTPAGAVDRILRVPVSQPTCVCFGGPDLDLLFVSSARQGLSAEQLAREPFAGDIFVYQLGSRGLPESQYLP
ncbi:MAG: SMP-30/gluconolactonase/LRE family protein [Steroidobacteraceae bacterium]